MKNYILTLLFALVTLTGCNNDEYYYKTPGEMTGEKLTELITANSYMRQCFISDLCLNGEPRRFSIEGQFLHLEADNYFRATTLDLNQLLRWEYVEVNNKPQSYFHFVFNTNDNR